MLPPSHTISAYTDSTNTSHQKYRRAMDQLSKLSHYKPLDNTAFHFYTPDKLKGIHRSQNSNNQTTAFNIYETTHQSYLRCAHKIEDFIMGLQITTKQRRQALWRSLSLPRIQGMMQKFGITAIISPSISIFLANNVTYFLARARET